MKKIIGLFIVVILLTQYSFSQEKTLIGNGDIRHGGYGALELKFTQIQDDFALMIGGKGIWLINSTFGLGFGGYGLVTEHPVENLNSTKNFYLETGYGGMLFEYVHSSDALVHFNLGALFGLGGAVYSDARTYKFEDDSRTKIYGRDLYFVFEPQLNAELNITSFFRLNIGGSYRMITGLQMQLHENKDLSGFSGNLTFKFGKF